MNPEEFLANFGLLAEAPGGAKKLREMIQELAVRGMLVEQYPDDESAEVLLSRITQERQQLMIGRRVGGRGQDLSDEEARGIPPPYDIPPNWKWCTLADVAGHIVDGTHHTPKYVAEGGIRFISAKDIKNGQIIFDGCRMISRAEYEELSKRCSPKRGDILVTKSGSIGDIAIVQSDEPFTLFESVALIPIVPSVDKDYASHVVSLGASGDFGKEHQKGVAVRHLHLKDLRRLPFPLPPLMEQRRIAARAKQLMALCDDLEAKQTRKHEAGVLLTRAALDALTSVEGPEEFAAAWQRVADNFEALLAKPESVRELRKTVLELAVRGKLVGQTPNEEPAPALLKKIAAEKARLVASGAIKPGKAREDGVAVEEPFPLPAGWAWSHIGDIFDVAGGIQKTPKRAPVKNHYPYLRVENVQRGRLDLSRIERFELAEGELERWRLAPGDLLIVEGNGSETEIGRCATWHGEIDDCVHQNHIIRCRPIKPGESAFTLLFLNSPSGMAEMKELAITTSGLYSLSVGKIRGIMIPVAPLAEQKRIIAKVDQLMALCDDLEAKLRDAEKGAQRLAEAMTVAMVA